MYIKKVLLTNHKIVINTDSTSAILSVLYSAI